MAPQNPMTDLEQRSLPVRLAGVEDSTLEEILVIQEAMFLLQLTDENVVQALDYLADNPFRQYPLSMLALRMQQKREAARAALEQLHPGLLQREERHGEIWFSLAAQDETVYQALQTLLSTYRRERESLRESVDRQTEIDRLRDRLAFSQELMSTILSNVGEILIVDLGGRVLASSTFVEEQLGIHKGSNRDLLCRQLGFDPFERVGQRCELERGNTTLEVVISDFISKRRRIGINLSIRDITAHKALQKAREAYEESRKKLFSMIAHELRNPTIGLQTFLEEVQQFCEQYLAEDATSPWQSVLAHLRIEAVRNQQSQALLQRVVNDIFDYVKLQRRQMRFSFEPDVTVAYLLARCFAQCAPLAKAKDVHLPGLKEDALAHLPTLTGDPDRLVQVLINIVRNAIQSTPAGGQVNLEAAASPSPNGSQAGPTFVTIRVRDTGKGMTEQEVAQVFSEYRGSSSDGIGLGLMISDLIVKAHHGKIAVESQPGRGTTFHIFLPANPD